MPVTADEARRLPPRELAVLATGSQGEPRAALGRLARGEHPDLRVHAGDTVVLSSRQIPGNELSVGRLVNELCARGALVRWEGHPPAPRHRPRPGGGAAAAHPAHPARALHAHPRRVPAAGAPRRRTPPPRACRRSAATCSPTARCWSSTTPGPGCSRRGCRAAGSAVVRDAGGAVEVADSVVEDRRRLAEFGLCVAVVQVDAASGAVVAAARSSMPAAWPGSRGARRRAARRGAGGARRGDGGRPRGEARGAAPLGAPLVPAGHRAPPGGGGGGAGAVEAPGRSRCRASTW